jgi:hypothetical protein
MFPAMDRLRTVTHRTERPWPTWHRWPAGEAAVFGLVLHTRAFLALGIDLPAWRDALPRVTALATSLHERGVLDAFAADGRDAGSVVDALAPELRAARPDVEALLTSNAET